MLRIYVKICRINGQLLLLMLAEKLISIGCKIIQANTDGLFVLRKRDNEEEFKKVCKEWEELTKLELEEDRFEGKDSSSFCPKSGRKDEY